MRINPSLANQMYLSYVNGEDSESASILPSGTYSRLAAAKYVKDNDKDNDGQLTQDEVSISEEAFAALDADSDGYISKTEMEDGLDGKDSAIFAYYKNGGGEKDVVSTVLSSNSSSATSASTYVELAAKAYLGANDADGSGALSSAEVKLDADVFSEIDADGNDSITAAELKSALSAKGGTISRYYQNGGTQKLSDFAASLLKTV